MIRICFLIHQLEAGGAERQLVTLLRGMDKSFFEITLMTFHAGGSFSEEAASIPGLRMVSLDKSGRWDFIGPLVRLIRTARETKAHILHGYMPTANVFMTLARPFVRGARVVWGIRAAQDTFTPADRHSEFAFKVQRRLSRLADLVIANSEAGRRVCVRIGFPPERVVVIPNGIDIERFHPDEGGRERLRSEWGIGENEIAIGIAGRLHPVKDHETFLRAAAILALERAEARFVCVGDGGPDHTSHLQELAGELGIADKVVWAGMRVDMPAAYSALDINTCCSVSEGFPNGVAEAMACSIPCAVTDVGDCGLLVGKTGIVVPPADPEALAGAWKRLLAQDFRTMGRQARKRIVGEFAMARLVERTEQVLWPKG